MKYLAIVAAGLVLAGCETMPGLPTVLPEVATAPPRAADAPRQEQFVALVEQSGCRVDPQDHAVRP